MASQMLPPCDARDAPDLPGMIRVVLLFENGEGTSAYFDPEALPDLMRGIDRIKDSFQRTYRSRCENERSWAKLRHAAIAEREQEPEHAMLLLLWLYFRHPKTRSFAATIQQVLAKSGRACLTVVYNRRSNTTIAAIAEGLADEVVELSGVRLPEGVTIAKMPPEPSGGRA
jgi:hypothetical protein